MELKTTTVEPIITKQRRGPLRAAVTRLCTQAHEELDNQLPNGAKQEIRLAKLTIQETDLLACNEAIENALMDDMTTSNK